MRRIRLAVIATLLALHGSAPVVLGASCNGNSHQPSLSAGSASPGSGSTSTPITFSVVYADTGDCPPSSVTVTVAGVGTFPMNATGSSWSSGTTFRVTATLPAGSHRYSFGATSGDGGGVKTAALASVSPGTVSIAAPPPPPPPPTPPPPPPPPPTPAPQPAVTPPPVVAPVPAVTPPPTAAPSPTPTPTPASSATVSPGGSPTSGPSATAAGSTGPVHDSWVPAPGAAPPNGNPSPAWGAEWTAPSWVASFLVTTTAGLAFFVVLVRRRLPPDRRAAVVTVSAPAAVPSGAASAETQASPLPPMRDLIPPVGPNLLVDQDGRIGPEPGEEKVPRWLRQSVRAGRGGPTELRHLDWR